MCERCVHVALRSLPPWAKCLMLSLLPRHIHVLDAPPLHLHFYPPMVASLHYQSEALDISIFKHDHSPCVWTLRSNVSKPITPKALDIPIPCGCIGLTLWLKPWCDSFNLRLHVFLWPLGGSFIPLLNSSIISP